MAGILPLQRAENITHLLGKNCTVKIGDATILTTKEIPYTQYINILIETIDIAIKISNYLKARERREKFESILEREIHFLSYIEKEFEINLKIKEELLENIYVKQQLLYKELKDKLDNIQKIHNLALKKINEKSFMLEKNLEFLKELRKQMIEILETDGRNASYVVLEQNYYETVVKISNLSKALI